MQKLYAYIDESGQDTRGSLFVVGVVVTEDQREELIAQLEAIEKKSGKGRVKWAESKDTAKIAYMRSILGLPALKRGLYYAVYHDTKDYLPLTVLTTAKAVLDHAQGEYKVTVYVDALQDAHRNRFGTELRQLHIRIRKVRGVRKDETDTLIRLADALCGCVRSAEADEGLRKLLEKAVQDGVVKTFQK